MVGASGSVHLGPRGCPARLVGDGGTGCYIRSRSQDRIREVQEPLVGVASAMDACPPAWQSPKSELATSSGPSSITVSTLRLVPLRHPKEDKLEYESRGPG